MRLKKIFQKFICGNINANNEAKGPNRHIKTKKYLEEFTTEERRKMWPATRALQERHIKNCNFLVNREKLLEYMPKNSICAEVGLLRCEFSEIILSITKPKKLHLFDIEEGPIKIASKKFADRIANGLVETRLGDSSESIMAMPDQYFDWIYIDGDHNYAGVKKDLEAARLKTKEDGLIVLNDYIYFAPSDFVKYGVIEAVNEFCIQHDFEIIYFALQGRMYNDVALRKINRKS